MKIRAWCDFDKGARAAWCCESCQAHYSERCIPDGHNPLWGRSGPLCLLCHDNLTATDDPAFAKPFWHVLPYLLLYPLHFNSLLVILTGVAGTAILGGGIPSLIFAFVFQLLCVKYFFAVLAARAGGKRWPPGLLCFIKSDTQYLLLKAVLVYLVQVMVVVAGYYYLATTHIPALYQLFILYALVAFMLLAFPAITMILAVEGALLRAINPSAIIGVMAGMGVYYVLLWVLLLVLGVAVELGVQLALPMLPVVWQLPLALGAATYCSLASYALFGYALYQFGAEAGLEIDVQEPMLDEREFVRAQGLGAVLVLEQRGDLERAREQLRELLNLYRDDLTLHRQYHRLLLKLDSPEAIRALGTHADYVLELLLLNNHKREAAELLQQTLAKVSSYRPAKLATTLALESHLRKCLAPRQLAGLLVNAHKHYRGDTGIPAAYKCLAELFKGPLKQPDKAQQLKDFIRREYPKG
ncbi:hypothetical protein [Gilvimarinus polysaccharolyticus]|uniref:hypothetical protein n=1 Tax=Gilvimarinus polysaccharolyticus TaxID=863921 RepID=UPI000673C3F7|nr:hypothetical protein [Gilvimarinus polysaccharolyticus]